ncbi:hypothetical protein [Halolamina salifodinae]|uniref:Sulfatase n=1 Tax=Halolamina salifodinae TaxID=1202767 RepID=A0A8T4GT85_9EURY|nr:hypothetical protein [Halolamina salifodinae]MBP1985610.1 hypothetical protein [Halolamina salifodinae]
MIYKLRRAVDIYREQGASVVVSKALRYLPIEVDNIFYRLRQDSPTKVMEENWDTLIILDACRYDLFEEINYLDGDLEHRTSLGSTSEEFLERNFTGEEYYDTVYVNANPYIPYLDLDQGRFHAVINLLQEWDDELQTVHPQTVVDAAREAHREYPNKRLIIHFMQPHVPFIGELGQDIQTKGWGPDLGDSSLTGDTIWQRLRLQDITRDKEITRVWEAYEENLGIALKHVEELLPDLDGDTVITADHGNLVGERLGPIPTERKFGHPLGVYHPALVKVPWFRIPGENDREVSSSPPQKAQTSSNEIVDQRLEALGYK